MSMTPPGYATLLDNFLATAAAFPEREAIRYFDGTLDYAMLRALVDAFAAWLAEHGVGRGDRVSIVLQNVPHVAVATLAAWRLGAIPVPVSPMYKPEATARILADHAPSAILCHAAMSGMMTETLNLAGLEGVPVATACPHDFQTANDSRVLPPRGPRGDFLEICARYRGRSVTAAPPRGEEIGLILYTSGTTGAPKGAVITHASLAFDASACAAGFALHAGSRVLALAPMFHITGFVLHMGVMLAAGCGMLLHYRVQPEAVMDLIRTYRPSFTIGAITAFIALMNLPGVTREDFASFESSFSGGAPIAPALREAVRERLGLDLHPVYGMTEACSATHIAPLGQDVPVDPSSGAISVGLAIAPTRARIVDADGRTLPSGEAGEIWVCGPQIMTGYWRKREESAVALVDGWLRTGDVGIIDSQGWLYVIDRQKDVIIASGFKVWPRAVEDALYRHEAVLEAAVIGVPHPYRGETVEAHVVLKPGATADMAELNVHCRSLLASYQTPTHIHLRTELPKTATGKVQRAALRAEIPSRE